LFSLVNFTTQEQKWIKRIVKLLKFFDKIMYMAKDKGEDMKMLVNGPLKGLF
jgi:hypothetical protein